MTWEPRPLPPIRPETRHYWEKAAEEELVLRVCQECGLTYHYPRMLCPDCLSDDVEWTTMTGRGTVYSYTVTDNDDWPEAESPTIVAYVQLTEGPRMITTIENCLPEAVEIGMEVVVDFISTEEEIGIPVFVLAGDD